MFLSRHTQMRVTMASHEDVPQELIDAFTDEVKGKAEVLLLNLDKAMPDMLIAEREQASEFRTRNEARWAPALDLLESLLVMCTEAGQIVSEGEGPQISDPKFAAIQRIHARSMLVSREALCLIRSGFADGALSRWRTLHELSVIAIFLANNEANISRRYLASRVFIARKAALELNQFAGRLNMEPFPDSTMQQFDEECEQIEALITPSLAKKPEYSWASPALPPGNPTFAAIEAAVGLDFYRPYFTWACDHTHGGSREPMSLLGAAEAPTPLLLVGESNGGMVDPIQLVSLSAAKVTVSFLSLRPEAENVLVYMQAISVASARIGPIAIDVEKRTLEENSGVTTDSNAP
jgi:hypothetical protein